MERVTRIELALSAWEAAGYVRIVAGRRRFLEPGTPRRAANVQPVLGQQVGVSTVGAWTSPYAPRFAADLLWSDRVAED